MVDPQDTPKLYAELAGWFHLLTAPEEYAEEAALYRGLLEEAGEVRTVLELGSGGGNNASHLAAHYEMTLVDASPAMLALSRAITPTCEHVLGDMRTIRLGRTFDAVFVHDAVVHMTSLDDLRAAMRTAYEHVRPGGVALFCPDHLRDTFAGSTSHGGHDDPSGERGLRYLQLEWDPDPADDTYTIEFAYLLREGRDVEVVHDRMVCGLFDRATWLATLREVGFHRAEARPGSDGAEVFLALR